MSCTPAALSAFGTLLQYSDDQGNNFVSVAELRNLSGPSMSADVIEVTVHNPVCGNSPYKQYIAGLLDGGEVTFDINFLPLNGTHNSVSGIVGVFTSRARRTWRILWPDEALTPWSFPGQVTSFQPSSNPSEALQASVTIKVTGAPTFGA